MTIRWKQFGLLLGFLLGTNVSHAQKQHIFLPVNMSRVRALGLAGAMVSLEDDLGAINFNPANFSLYREYKSFRLTFFLSPLAPYILAKQRDLFFGYSPDKRASQAATVLSLFKAINITIKSLDIGFQFGEPRILDLSRYQDRPFLHAVDVYQNQYQSVFFRWRLAQQVAVGSSLHLMYYVNPEGRRKWTIAATYGVTMQPHRRIRFGVNLHTFPNEISTYRNRLENIVDEAINLGLSYLTPWQSSISINVRNVGMSTEGPREQYLAAVEQEIFHQVALRGGVQYNIEENHFVYTMGVGLLNLNMFFGESGKFKNSNYALNYALIIDRRSEVVYYIHAFSFFLRL